MVSSNEAHLEGGSLVIFSPWRSCYGYVTYVRDGQAAPVLPVDVHWCSFHEDYARVFVLKFTCMLSISFLPNILFTFTNCHLLLREPVFDSSIQLSLPLQAFCTVKVGVVRLLCSCVLQAQLRRKKDLQSAQTDLALQKMLSRLPFVAIIIAALTWTAVCDLDTESFGNRLDTRSVFRHRSRGLKNVTSGTKVSLMCALMTACCSRLRFTSGSQVRVATGTKKHQPATRVSLLLPQFSNNYHVTMDPSWPSSRYTQCDMNKNVKATSR